MVKFKDLPAGATFRLPEQTAPGKPGIFLKTEIRGNNAIWVTGYGAGCTCMVAADASVEEVELEFVDAGGPEEEPEVESDADDDIPIVYSYVTNFGTVRLGLGDCDEAGLYGSRSVDSEIDGTFTALRYGAGLRYNLTEAEAVNWVAFGVLPEED